MKYSTIHVFNRIGILTKLGLLLILPAIAIAASNYYSARTLEHVSSKLITAIYDEAYQGVELILNADRDLYQSYIGYLMLGTTQMEDPAAEIDENVVQVQERAAGSRAIYEQNTEVYGAFKSSEGLTMFEHYDEFDKNFANYIRLIEQAKQEGGTNQNTFAAVSVVFEEARSQLNAIQEIVEETAVETINTQQAEKSKSVRVAMTITFIVIVVLLLLGYGVARSIRQMLEQVSRRSELVASGDLAGEDLPIYTRDSIGKLAAASNHMRRELAAVVSRIKTESEQLAATSEQLSVSSEETARSAEQIALSMQEVAIGTERQVLAVERSRQTALDMAALMDAISTNVDQTAQASQQAAAIASTGNATVEEAVAKMRLIDSKVRHAAEISGYLEIKSQRIDEILGLLSEISNQTNLLALNASIEAAKAGEHGRGFAVVAVEVRKLAERSQASSNDIQSLIHEVQLEIARLSKSMQEGLNAAGEGLLSVDETGQAFRSIVQSIDEVALQMDEVTNRSAQIQQGTGDMVAAMEEVSSLTEQFAGNTQTVAAASEEQNAAMEEIGSASQLLAKMAEDLLQAVGKFKV
jgi:methyl-accepting chemotaxis protein